VKINGEPVKLVESFEELRPGMIVYDVLCETCGRKNCRSMVGNESDCEPCESGADETCDSAIEMIPNCDPDPETGFNGLCKHDIATGRIYRVIDEQLDADTTGERTTRELERVR
jgi:hypothetical protein